MRTVTEEEIEESIDEHASVLADYARQHEGGEEFGSSDAVILAFARGVMDGHEWFTKSEYGAAVAGQVVEYLDEEREVYPSMYSDLSTAFVDDDVVGSIRRMAALAFEAAAIERAKRKLEAEGDVW